MIELLTMRLKDMHRVHPDQVTKHCARCGHEVGVYPSGQRVLAEHPETVIVCQVCKTPNYNITALAPGAEFEPFESRKRK